MKKIKKILATITLGAVALSTVGCKMIEKTPEAIANTTVAVVGTEKITKGDVDREFKQYESMLKQQYGDNYLENKQVSEQVDDLKRQLLNKLVENNVLLQKAGEAGLMPTDDEINAKVDEAMKEIPTETDEDKEKYNNFLEFYGFTDEAFKDYQRKGATINLIINNLTKDITVTDEDAQKYYDENKDTAFSQPGPVNYDKSLEAAKNIKAELAAGKSFEEVASAESKDPGTKSKGGSLGFVEYDNTNFVPEFMEAVKTLKDGEISEPVKSKFGYHIIKVTGVKEDGAEVSHILAAENDPNIVTPFDSVKDQIISQLTQEKYSQTIEDKIAEMKKGIKIKTYEDKL